MRERQCAQNVWEIKLFLKILSLSLPSPLDTRTRTRAHSLTLSQYPHIPSFQNYELSHTHTHNSHPRTIKHTHTHPRTHRPTQKTPTRGRATAILTSVKHPQGLFPPFIVLVVGKLRQKPREEEKLQLMSKKKRLKSRKSQKWDRTEKTKHCRWDPGHKIPTWGHFGGIRCC